ncbi:MAG: hypothetical protein NTW16_03910 [Bacteroidetes bacterium]|nr:hypothetical protein [Bacteroidota bacterium]
MKALANILIYITLGLFTLSSGQALAQSIKGQSMRMHTIPLTKKKEPELVNGKKPLIGFVSLKPYDHADPEMKEAYDLVKTFDKFSVEFLSFKEIEQRSKKNSRFSIIWIHRPDTTAFSAGETNEKLLGSLKSYIENGGKLLLTSQASYYINLLGFEPLIFQDSTKPCADNCKFLQGHSNQVLELSAGKGKVLTFGGYLNFSTTSSSGEPRNLFTQSCFNCLLDY